MFQQWSRWERTADWHGQGCHGRWSDMGFILKAEAGLADGFGAGMWEKMKPGWFRFIGWNGAVSWVWKQVWWEEGRMWKSRFLFCTNCLSYLLNFHARPGGLTHTGSILSALVSNYCCNKSPWMSWLKTKLIYSLGVMKFRNIKSRHQQGCVPHGSFKGNLFPCCLIKLLETLYSLALGTHPPPPPETLTATSRHHTLSGFHLLLFHSPLSLSSRGSLVLLHFLPWGWCHLHIWSYWYFFQHEVIDISSSNLDSSLCFIQPGILCDVVCI